MFERLFRPLRRASTWKALVHSVLDLPVGVALFLPVVVLVQASIALVITFPLALIAISILFGFARIAGRVERSRLAALHDVRLPDPIPALAPGSWWNRFLQRLKSVPRWKEIGYCLLRLPTGAAFTVVTLMAWCGSAALLLLPLSVRAFPGDRAHFWLFDVSFGPAAFGAALIGLTGLVAVAPWVTVVIGRLDVSLARWLLAPSPGAELAAQVTRAETRWAAAVETAEAERRRIERDLHDGAQPRLVALAMDLGAARQRLETDPEAGRQLVAEAHEERGPTTLLVELPCGS